MSVETEFLILDLESPFAGFGGVGFDGFSGEIGFPTKSMMTGLIGNALGWSRKDTSRLQELQDAMSITVGVARDGHFVDDFQTADLTSPYMKGPMWTASAAVFKREASSGASTTAVRIRPYRADSRFLCALSFAQRASLPNANDMLSAVREPMRPLFVGRAGCLPSKPIGHSVVAAEDGMAAIEEALPGVSEHYLVESDQSLQSVPGLRDFRDNSHRGSYFVERVLSS